MGLPGSSVGKESAAMQETDCNVGELGLIPVSERSLEEGNRNRLQYFCLGNLMDGEA